jgi:hypothetical protein
MVAWRVIIGGTVEPVAAIPYGDRDMPIIEVQRKWEEVSAESGIFGEQGVFLISVSGVGASKAPWAQVRRGRHLQLAHMLPSEMPEADFVAMSMDGTTVCGVTNEEWDFWIVRERLV